MRSMGEPYSKLTSVLIRRGNWGTKSPRMGAQRQGRVGTQQEAAIGQPRRASGNQPCRHLALGLQPPGRDNARLLFQPPAQWYFALWQPQDKTRTQPARNQTTARCLVPTRLTLIEDKVEPAGRESPELGPERAGLSPLRGACLPQPSGLLASGRRDGDGAHRTC